MAGFLCYSHNNRQLERTALRSCRRGIPARLRDGMFVAVTFLPLTSVVQRTVRDITGGTKQGRICRVHVQTKSLAYELRRLFTRAVKHWSWILFFLPFVGIYYKLPTTFQIRKINERHQQGRSHKGTEQRLAMRRDCLFS